MCMQLTQCGTNDPDVQKMGLDNTSIADLTT